MTQDVKTRPDRTPGTLWVSVVTPEGAAFEGEATSVVIPAHDGEVAFLAGHAAFVGAVGVGELRVHLPGATLHRFFLAGGVAQVLDNHVSILAEQVTPADGVDPDLARRDLEEALKALPTTGEMFIERDRALVSARARLIVAEHAAQNLE